MDRVGLAVLEFAPRQEGQPVTSALDGAVRTAVVADECGYRRVWVAEHHRIPAFPTPSPAILVGRMAAATARIGVGSGGVLLGNHRPLDVAEQWATLASLFPGRIDLGLGRGNGTFDPEVVAALQATPGHNAAEPHAADAQAYERDLQVLLDLLDPSTEPAPLPDGPAGADGPEPWLLASSPHSAGLAARLGLPLVVAHHQRPQNTDAAVRTYRERFAPSRRLGAPWVGVSAIVLCAEDDDTAADLLRPAAAVLGGDLVEAPNALPDVAAARRAPGPGPAELRAGAAAFGACGSPTTVRDGVEALVERTGADELFVLPPVSDPTARATSLRLTHDACA